MKDKTIYLTFDFDWACDEIIEKTLNIIRGHDVRATLFLTNKIFALKELESDSRFELGIHPNFTPLVENTIYHKDFISNARNIINDLLSIIPQATSIRSHGLTINTRLLDLFKDMGLTRESNILYTISSGINIEAYYHWNNLIRIPFIFEDDIHCVEVKSGNRITWDIEPYFDKDRLWVFNFHPIHIWLNTEDLSRYEKCRLFLNDPLKLKEFINHSNKGACCFLESIIEYGKNNGYQFGLLNSVFPPVS